MCKGEEDGEETNKTQPTSVALPILVRPFSPSKSEPVQEFRMAIVMGYILRTPFKLLPCEAFFPAKPLRGIFALKWLRYADAACRPRSPSGFPEPADPNLICSVASPLSPFAESLS
nr:hypothetical protein Iba_chr02eCG8570 [Ipomoea batatas]